MGFGSCENRILSEGGGAVSKLKEEKMMKG